MTADIFRYTASAGEFLERQAAANTILLTAAETVRARGVNALDDHSPLFGWWQDPEGKISGAFLHTPPYPVVLTAMAAGAAVTLASSLADHGDLVPGVTGDVETARQFAAAWQARTGQAARVQRRSRLYRLHRLNPPDPAPPGGPRIAGPADRNLLIAWFEAFGREAGETMVAADRAVDDHLSYGGLTLWEVGDRPVSLAGVTRMVAGQVRVAPVYTPPELRRNGFAGAVTAAVSRAAVEAGTVEVLLFTDLANPTSNALYQGLGYRPIADNVTLVFGSP